MKIWAVLAIAVPLFGQTNLKETLAKHWKISGEFLYDVANAMPAEHYTFKPSPEEMSFGQLMAHTAGSNMAACANASGLARMTMPAKITEWSQDMSKVEPDKATILPFIKDIFEYCDKAVQAMTDERMHTIVGPPARKLTGFEWLWGYYTHTSHHRGQAEVYLRVKGIKPPEYRY